MQKTNKKMYKTTIVSNVIVCPKLKHSTALFLIIFFIVFFFNLIYP
ncbi:MAG: hypothetical protein RLZZ540_2190 [Bacteroidota bacterium]|jgi:hypothetical protein